MKKICTLLIVTVFLFGQDTVSEWSLESIQTYCPDIGQNEVCNGTPFSEFTIRGTEGSEEDDERWWWVDNNTLGLSDFNQGFFIVDETVKRSGATEIRIRDGHEVKIKFQFETKGDRSFLKKIFSKISSSYNGIVELGDDYFIALMVGGDALSIDIDNDWLGTPPFYLMVQGKKIASGSKRKHTIDDEVYITLLEVDGLKTVKKEAGKVKKNTTIQYSSGCKQSGARSFAIKRINSTIGTAQFLDLQQANKNNWLFYGSAYSSNYSRDVTVFILIGCSGGSYSVLNVDVQL